MAGRNSDAEARRTRERILHQAADLASEQGLENVSIGQLAEALGLSKAGVVGPFGSKQNLQLATLDLAVDTFMTRVWIPVRGVEPGLDRLEAVCESWTDYLANPPFRGGCFLAAATFEWDSRSGPVRDALKASARAWTRILEEEVRTAAGAGQLPRDVDPAQVVFTLEALAAAATPALLLHGDRSAVELCLRAMRATLGLP